MVKGGGLPKHRLGGLLSSQKMGHQKSQQQCHPDYGAKAESRSSAGNHRGLRA
jgi:hypothetical protein